jgi:pyrroline-5-carboxylate reductase
MTQKIGFIGAGNMCQTLVQGWLSRKLAEPADILVSNRTPGKVQKLIENSGVIGCATNEELVEQADVVILAVKPQDLIAAVEPISSAFGNHQIVISLAAGIGLSRLKKLVPTVQHLARVMANTPARVGRGAFGYCTPGKDLRVDRWMEAMFAPLGLCVRLDEGEPFQAFAVATSAGVGFVFELMLYWQEWLEERGISAEMAQKMTVHTFLGAGELALASEPQSLVELQAKVTSKKGITAAGLESMRELEVERLLRYSFEKSALRDRELSED